jgi:hypothetical protein
MAHVDVGSGDRPPVLEQERQVRSERGQQRADKAQPDCQREVAHRGSSSRIGRLRPAVVGGVLARRAGDQARTHELALAVVEAAAAI